MRKSVALLVLIVLPTLIFAQTSGKLSGVITDENGNPLAGANVLLVGTTQGTATDADGQYYILNVPVGTYSVRTEYIGYKTFTVDNVHVSADLTTWLDFNLEVAALEGEEVTVTAEKPIVNLNATNTNRIIETEVIENLPLRNVQSLVDLQTGVVDGHVRGSRVGDNAYYVDGVLVRNQWNGGNITNGISRSGTQEVSVQTGGFSAEYGSANGGVVNITSKSGGSKWAGSLEFVTDVGASPGVDADAIYSWGYNLLNFDVGGPLSDNIHVYFNVEKNSSLDNEPANTSHPEADVYELTTLVGNENKIWEGGDPANGFAEGVIYYEEFVRMNQDDPALLSAFNATEAGEGLNIDSVAKYHPDWVDTTWIYANNYSSVYGPRQGAEMDRLAITGNMVLDLKPLRIKVGGTRYSYMERTNNSTYQLLNSDQHPVTETGMNLGYVSGTFTLSPKSLVRATVSLKDYSWEEYNDNFGHDVMDIGRRTTDIGSVNYYYRDHGLNALAIPGLVSYDGYGAQWNRSIQRDENTLGFRGDYINQIGRHELKGGMEYYNTTIRYYRVSQAREIYGNVATVDDNFDGEVTLDEIAPFGYDSIEDWEYFVYRNAYTYNIGYNIFGDETDEYSLDDHGQEPGKAITNRIFLNDKIEFRDVVLNMGLSWEYFNPNTYGPDSDGDGYADDAGFDNLHLVDGRVDRSGDQTGSYKWEPVEAYSALQPRLGFSFPVTDRTVFHAQYGKYWQSPPLAFLYLSDSRLAANLTQGNQTASPNPTLEPEKTTSYEIGFTQQLGMNAAIDLTGFYKEVRDYVMLMNRGDEEGVTALVDGSEFSWAQYMNGDFGVTQGFAVNVRLRRTYGFMANFNYTAMWARGTGSDPLSNWNITWTGDTYPTIINRLDFDQRHTGSLMLDYRTESRNPALSNLGVNAVWTFGSGQAYTPSYAESAIYGRGWWAPDAAINSGDLPWYNNIDIRVDKGFEVGGVNLNVYATLINAFNNVNVNTVYASTGQAGEDGFLAMESGQVWLESQIANYPEAPAQELYYDRLNSFQDALLDPVRYGNPRSLRIGVQVKL